MISRLQCTNDLQIYAPLKVFCKLFAAYCLEVIVCKFYFIKGIFFANN